MTIAAAESKLFLYGPSLTALCHVPSISLRPPQAGPSRRQHASRPPFMSTPSDLSPVATLNEKTPPVSQGTQSPTAWDGKAEADRRSLSPSLAPQPPASTRSTFASVCIVAACTSAQLASIGLGPAFAISVPYAGKDLHIQKENLQWILNAYSISSVNNFRRMRRHRYGKAHVDPAHRHASFFSVADWQTSTVANECGLLDT